MNVNNILLREKLSHKAVREVPRAGISWFQKRLGYEKMKAAEPGQTMTHFMNSCLADDPELFAEYSSFLEVMPDYQTIMLATNWTLKEVIDYEAKASNREFEELLERCEDVLGGTARDFLRGSGTGTKPESLEKPENSNSKRSSDQHGTPSEKPGESSET